MRKQQFQFAIPGCPIEAARRVSQSYDDGAAAFGSGAPITESLSYPTGVPIDELELIRREDRKAEFARILLTQWRRGWRFAAMSKSIRENLTLSRENLTHESY